MGNLNKFNQESHLDDTPGRRPIDPLSQKNAFFFEDDDIAVCDFNKIDNNFSNISLKGKDSSSAAAAAAALNGRDRRISNLKPNIPVSQGDPRNDRTVGFAIGGGNQNNAFNNSFNNNKNNNSFNVGAFDFFGGGSSSNNYNSGNKPVKISGDSIKSNNAAHKKTDGFKAIDDFNQIFGNPNLNQNSNNINNNNNNNNNNNQFNYGNNPDNKNRAPGNDFGFNDEANIIFETQNDFGNVNNNSKNNFNMYGDVHGNFSNNNVVNSHANNFNKNFDFPPLMDHNPIENKNNKNTHINNMFNNNTMQANPGINNIGIIY